MKRINKTYHFKLYPNKEPEVLLSKHFEWVRFLYNYLLNEHKAKLLNYQDQDLNQGDIKNTFTIPQHTAYASWGNFINLLEYQCDGYDRQLIKIDRYYLSSKICNQYGWDYQDLKLSMRTWTCNECQTIHDRNIIASKNILILLTRTVSYMGRDSNKTSFMKPEVQLSFIGE